MDIHIDIPIEVIPRDVHLSGAAFRQCDVEGACGQLRDTIRPTDVDLVLGDLLKERELLHFLEAT